MAALLWLPWLMLLAGVQQSSEIKDNNRNKNPRQDSDADRLITGPLLRKPLIPELSQRETHALLNSVPQIDHIVVFYVPLNSICRQFMNLFMALSRQFKTEQKSVKFAKVNCYGSFYGENLCQKYNIHAVPTVVYVSSLPLQPGALPADSFIRRGFLWCISRFVEDIHSPHATSYKGDVFIYDELRDWATIMYRLSQIKRSLSKIKLPSIFGQIKKLLTP